MLRWTTQLLPPELMGSHIASGRRTPPGGCTTCPSGPRPRCSGTSGIEWDLALASEAELAELAEWVAFYKEHRGLLLGGDLVRMDFPDPAVLLHGVVAPDRSAAIYAYVALAVSDVVQIGRVLCPAWTRTGATGCARFRSVNRRGACSGRPGGVARRRRGPGCRPADAWRAWPTSPGRAWCCPAPPSAATGLMAPGLDPEQAVLFEARAVD